MIYRSKWVLFIVLSLAVSAAGQAVLETTDDLRRIDVDEHLGDTLPTGLTFFNEAGEEVALGSFLEPGKPLVLVLGYYECPMLCNLVFNGLIGGIRHLDWLPGEEYRILTVSIDPAETPELATAKKANYLKELGLDIDPSGWTFVVGRQDQIDKLADAVGFKYFYDEDRDEYAHPAVIFMITDEGVISRYLYGIEFERSDMRLALLEASKGELGDTIDRIILYCFHYDPDSEGYVVVAANVMKVGGALTLLVLGLFVSLLWWGEKRRRGRVPPRGAEMEKVKA